MFKLFSMEEANKLIPTVETLVNDMQDSVEAIQRLRAELGGYIKHTVEAQNKVQELHFLANTVEQTKLELDRMGVFVQDMDAGLVDFPSQVGGEVVCLSWEKGENAIQHYHRLNEGTRIPLA